MMPMPLIKTFKHLQIQLEAIKSATNNFDEANCIGRGGFGKVYKGELEILEVKTMVALKRLDRINGQSEVEFWQEVIMLSQYKHENIVSLLGFCDDGEEKILVYEYVSKGSLDLYLERSDLTWARRLRICIGAARGLAHFHSSMGTQQRVLHRDVKSSNILLDENWDARISDLGLSKFGPANQQYTFLVSRTVGTIGYCDPSYVETGLLTKESDVYSFGVVLFEVFCGRLCFRNGDNKHLPFSGLVRQFYEQNKIDELVFTHIKDEINPNSLKAFASIAYQCLNRDRETRPLMTGIVRELEKALEYQGVPMYDHHQENYDITYRTSTTFHFMRARRERFGLEEFLGASAKVLGGSSLGTSYKAVLSKGSVLVAKRFKRVIKKEIKVDFHEHMMLLGNLSHPNLLPYVACYYNKDMKLLITDFAVNGSMASHLHVEPNNGEPGLDWPTRLKIIQGVASGLKYLYEQFPDVSLPHGHLKSSNVLLDNAFNPLLSDYALAPILEEIVAKEYIKVYKSPEFTKHKRVTKKTDVWCLGILILEMLTGISLLDYLGRGKSTEHDLVTWVNSIGREEWTNKVFDEGMKWAKNNEIEMIDLMEMGLHCCESDVTRRWDIRKVSEKILLLRDTGNEEEYLSDSIEGQYVTQTVKPAKELMF